MSLRWRSREMMVACPLEGCVRSVASKQEPPANICLSCRTHPTSASSLTLPPRRESCPLGLTHPPGGLTDDHETDLGPAVREQILQRMSPPNRESVTEIARSTRIEVPTLYSWRYCWQQEGQLVLASSKAPEQWSISIKAKADWRLAFCAHLGWKDLRNGTTLRIAIMVSNM